MLRSYFHELGQWHARLRRVRHKYLHHHGRTPRVFRPRRFTEKVVWRKLFDLDPRYAMLSDKLAVRDFIAGRIGTACLIPLQWQGSDPSEIPFDDLAPPYVVKSTHASGHWIFVNQGQCVDRDAIRSTAARWLNTCHGTAYDEPAYVHVPRRLIVERQLRLSDNRRPIERKFFVFHGKIALIVSTIIDDNRVRYSAFHTPEWDRLPPPRRRPIEGAALPRPAMLDQMMHAASRLTEGFDHLRIDMYDGEVKFWVGEVTVYDFSGMRTLSDDIDYRLGALWKLRHPLPRALTTVLTRPCEISPGVGN